MIDLADVDAGVLDDLAERGLDTLEQVSGQLLELRAGQRLVQVDRAVLGHREVLHADVGARRGGQLFLGLFFHLFYTFYFICEK